MGFKYINVKKINKAIDEDYNSFVSQSEDIYHEQLENVADKIILDCKEKPLVLLSGPSGSGKTTSALRIAKLIEQKSNYKAITISMDNYFLPDGAMPQTMDENGKIDYESPTMVDIPLFSEHLVKLFNCEPIEIPIFDFATHSRTGSVPVHREKNEIIIIEGIHALNPMVTGDTNKFTTCIYVSVRTRLKNDNGDVLHPSKIRLMRRLGRDKLFRGRRLEDIFSFFSSVSRGENLYIMPYKPRADFDIDTFIPYEANVYKNILLPELIDIESIMCGNNDYTEIVKFLKELDSLSASAVPYDSIVREFIGGSTLNY